MAFTVRPVDPVRDADAHVRSVIDSPAFVTKSQYTETVEAAEAFLGDRDTRVVFAIVDENTSETVGFAGMTPPGAAGVVGLFWSVVPERRREGAARSGAEFLIDHVREQNLGEYVGMLANKDNAASIGLAETLHFVRDGEEWPACYASGTVTEIGYKLKL